MLENPCFIISLQTGTKVIAAVDIILAAVPLIIFLCGVIPSFHENQTHVNSTGQTEVSILIVDTNVTESPIEVIVHEKEVYFNAGIWTIMILFVVVDIGMSYILFKGASHKYVKKLKGWFWFRLVTLILTTVIVIVSICLGAPVRIVLYDCFHNIYRIYCLWVVHAFVEEILAENRRMQTYSYSTYQSRHPPAIVVTGAEETMPNNSMANGNSKFGFHNFAFS